MAALPMNCHPERSELEGERSRGISVLSEKNLDPFDSASSRVAELVLAQDNDLKGVETSTSRRLSGCQQRQAV